MKNDRVLIFDTTLRDGEQAPGATMSSEEKLEIAFSLERLGLMKNIKTAPLILINGDNDPYIPKTDVTKFDGIPNIETRIIPNSGHCAASKIGEVMPWVIGWLKEKLN